MIKPNFSIKTVQNLNNYQIIHYQPEWNVNIWFFFLKEKKMIMIVDIYQITLIWNLIIKEFNGKFNLKDFQLNENVLIFNNVDFETINEKIILHLKDFLLTLKLENYFENSNPYWFYMFQTYQLINFFEFNIEFCEGKFYVIDCLWKDLFLKKKFKIFFYISEKNNLKCNKYGSIMYEYIKKFLLKDNDWFLYTNNISLNPKIFSNYSSINGQESFKEEYWIKNLQYKKFKFNEINQSNISNLLYPDFVFFIEEFSDDTNSIAKVKNLNIINTINIIDDNIGIKISKIFNNIINIKNTSKFNVINIINGIDGISVINNKHDIYNIHSFGDINSINSINNIDIIIDDINNNINDTIAINTIVINVINNINSINSISDINDITVIDIINSIDDIDIIESINNSIDNNFGSNNTIYSIYRTYNIINSTDINEINNINN